MEKSSPQSHNAISGITQGLGGMRGSAMACPTAG
jgi:hypothetical protein